MILSHILTHTPNPKSSKKSGPPCGGWGQSRYFFRIGLGGVTPNVRNTPPTKAARPSRGDLILAIPMFLSGHIKNETCQQTHSSTNSFSYDSIIEMALRYKAKSTS